MTPAEIALADALLSQGLSFWADFQNRKTTGTLTMTDLDEAGTKLDLDIAQLKADIEAQQAAKG